MWSSSGVTKLTALALLAGGLSCKSMEATSAPASDDGDDIAELTQELSAIPDASCVWNATGGAFTLNIPTNEIAVVSTRVVDNVVLVNGFVCPSTLTAPPTKTTLKTLSVNGTTAGNETLVLDYLNGFFATAISATTGTVVDLRTGTDAIKIRGTKNNDTITCGATACNVNGDANADIKPTGVESMLWSLGTGNDVMRGNGASTGGVGTSPMTVSLTVFGGTGTDTLVGGNGNDSLYGDEGNDVLTAEATSGSADRYSGGADVDSLSYAGRPMALSLSKDTAANDGDPAANSGAGEGDNIGDDIETITSGDGNDTITGGATAETLTGGLGSDTLRGGAGNDTLDGGDGNDVFVALAAADGDDTMNGGGGTDHADYSARTIAVTITVGVDGDNDGSMSENDKVKADVENVSGGSDDDNITGSALANRITGGMGNDTLHGGVGDDFFAQNTAPTTAGEDDDVVDGGDGFDTVDYSGRTGAVMVTFDAVANDGTGSEADDIQITVEKIIGTASNDTIDASGTAFNVWLVGGEGDDTLTGGSGDDTLEGGDGDDAIQCGAGDDTAYPGTGTNDLTGSQCDLIL